MCIWKWLWGQFPGHKRTIVLITMEVVTFRFGGLKRFVEMCHSKVPPASQLLKCGTPPPPFTQLKAGGSSVTRRIGERARIQRACRKKGAPCHSVEEYYIYHSNNGNTNSSSLPAAMWEILTHSSPPFQTWLQSKELGEEVRLPAPHLQPLNGLNPLSPPQRLQRQGFLWPP